MTSYEPGEVVLVRYPFSDLTTSKRRPAVVLSPRSYSDRFGDVVLMPLTSQSEPDASFALSDWKSATSMGFVVVAMMASTTTRRRQR